MNQTDIKGYQVPKFFDSSPLAILVVAISYMVVMQVVFLTATLPRHISPIFPSAGIALAAVMLLGPRALWGVWLGEFLGYLMPWLLGQTVFSSLGEFCIETSVAAALASGAAAGAATGTWLVHKFCRGACVLDRVRNILVLILVGNVGATLISPTIGVLALASAGFVSWSGFGYAWLTWWIGDAVGSIIVAPLLLAWFQKSLFHRNEEYALEAVVLGGSLFLFCYLVFFQGVPFEYGLMPLLLWAAFRFDVRGASIAATLVAVLATLGTVRGTSPFVEGTVNASLLHLESFLAVTVVCTLIPAGIFSEQRRAEAQVQESENQFRLLVESAPEAIFVQSQERFLYVNPSMLKLLGASSPAELIGMHIMERIAPEFHEAIRERIRIQNETGNSVPPMSQEYYRMDGTCLTVETTAVAIPYLGKQAHLVFVRDITERKRVEEALRESEGRFRILLENIPAITYLTGVSQELVNPTIYISPQIIKLTSYTMADFINDPHLWISLIHPADRARVVSRSEQADLTGDSFAVDYRVIDKEQKIYWVHDENVLVKNDYGQPLYRVGVWTDITERKRAEEALQRSEDLYRRAIDAAGAVPYVLDHTTRTFIFIGEGILAMTGYSAAEMMHSNSWNSLVQEGFPRGRLANLSYEEADRLTEVDSSIPWECDYRICTRTGETRWIADASVKSLDEHSGHILSIGIKQDITARKEAEGKIRLLNETLETRVIERTAALQAANRELEAFSYSVSHDLRAPLRAINGFTRILEEEFGGELSDPARSYLQKIHGSSDKMSALIDSLLKLSRLGRKPIQKQLVDVNALVHALIEALAPEIAGRPIEWILADLPPANADPQLLQQVYANLLGNAVKYSRDRIPARIETGALTQSDALVYFVRDNGAGFDMRYADKLFGVFQRLHSEREFEGTGIGLAIIQRIIQRHGGRIWAEAEPGKGATFYFTLE